MKKARPPTVRACFESRACSRIFPNLLQLGNKRLRPAAHIAEFADLPAILVEHDDRRVALDLVFVLQRAIGLFLLVAQLFLDREIHLDDHQVLPGVVGKLGRGENLLVKFHAPNAPVRAGEYLGARGLGLELTRNQLERYEVYYRELMEWNRRVNLTHITGYEEVQVKHFLDSLTVALAVPLAVNKGLRLIDVGTGAGIPGIPLKIAFPALKLVLLEAVAKKAAFLRYIVPKLGLNDIEILVGRAEEVAHQAQYREQFNLVLSRAVAPLPTVVELALPFCALGGGFIAQKKGDIDTELGSAERAIATLGGSLRVVKAIDLPQFADKRCLVVIDKVSPTPEKYPRRPGIPAKRPLL